MTPADLERFRRLAGMLGSEHVGERAAAALMHLASRKQAPGRVELCDFVPYACWIN